MAENGDPQLVEVDAALSTWRQGDCVLGEHWFVYRFDKTLPVNESASIASEADVDLAEDEVAGLVVIAQTCDIVRSCTKRPFVEVCPLVEVDETLLDAVRRGRRSEYALVPLLASKRLVAHLDRVMTVEKPVVARWERTPGWTIDAEARRFALALARKRARFAFPDDFVESAERLRNRISEKHEKSSDEGRGLRALREIRIQASPSWDAPWVELFFWFVREDEAQDFEGKSWADLLAKWLKLFPKGGRFESVHGQVVELQEMTARDYVDSDPLDLDHLSSR